MLQYSLGLTILFLIAPPEPPRRHCQIPCGIYGDKMRVDMIMEDAATIEKGMEMIRQLGKEGTNFNQIVRWTVNKDQHAQAIQSTVAAYWLAQRIKQPKSQNDADWKKYRKQLELMHGITVAAMKCKQTTDTTHVAALRRHLMEFAQTYFSAEDLKHLQEHHGTTSRPHR